MALIKCENCGKEISDKTSKCIHCGTEIGMMKGESSESNQCKECGVVVLETDTFCPNCGCPISKTENKSQKNNKMIKLVIIPLISIFIIAGMVFGIIFLMKESNLEKAKDLYKNGKVEALQTLYNEMNDEDVKQMNEYLNELCNNVNEDYINKEISYEDAKDKILEINKNYKKEMDSSICAKISKDINTLYLSRNHFEAAESFYADGKYEEAYNSYKKVDMVDDNYDIAQENIEKLKPLIAEKYFNEAKAAFDKQDFATAKNKAKKSKEYVTSDECDNFIKNCENEEERVQKEKEEQERQAKLLYPGKKISNGVLDITYNSASLTKSILPTDTSGAYSYRSADSDEIFLDLIFKVKNNSDYDAKISVVEDFAAKYGTKNYNYCNLFYCELDDTYVDIVFSWESIKPLKEVVYHVVLTLPYEAVNTSDTIAVSFKLAGQEQILEFR